MNSARYTPGLAYLAATEERAALLPTGATAEQIDRVWRGLTGVSGLSAAFDGHDEYALIDGDGARVRIVVRGGLTARVTGDGIDETVAGGDGERVIEGASRVSFSLAWGVAAPSLPLLGGIVRAGAVELDLVAPAAPDDAAAGAVAAGGAAVVAGAAAGAVAGGAGASAGAGAVGAGDAGAPAGADGAEAGIAGDAGADASAAADGEAGAPAGTDGAGAEAAGDAGAGASAAGAGADAEAGDVGDAGTDASAAADGDAGAPAGSDGVEAQAAGDAGTGASAAGAGAAVGGAAGTAGAAGAAGLAGQGAGEGIVGAAGVGAAALGAGGALAAAAAGLGGPSAAGSGPVGSGDGTGEPGGSAQGAPADADDEATADTVAMPGDDELPHQTVLPVDADGDGFYDDLESLGLYAPDEEDDDEEEPADAPHADAGVAVSLTGDGVPVDRSSSSLPTEPLDAPIVKPAAVVPETLPPTLPLPVASGLGDHDGQTMLPGEAAAARAGDHDGDTITADEARALRPAPPATPAAEAARPVARVFVSNGAEVRLDRPVLIGRRPRSVRQVGDDVPHLITVESPMHDISRNHVEIKIEDDAAIVTDLNSTNGTLLFRDGDPQRLHPGERTVLIEGDTLDIGEGVIVSFAGLP